MSVRGVINLFKRPNLVSGLFRRSLIGFGIFPLSFRHGFDRGKPIHRFYIDEFLKEHQDDIKGKVLEFEDSTYARRFGKGGVTKVEIIHKDKSNPRATIVADLTTKTNIPTGSFDCIICTHVFHVVFEIEKMISELYRILKPGGVLLVAVPQTGVNNPFGRAIWRLTPEGMRLLLVRSFKPEKVFVRSYGNSLTALGEMRGLVAEEFNLGELRCHDFRFGVEVCARAAK